MKKVRLILTSLSVGIFALLSGVGSVKTLAQLLDPVCSETPQATVCQENTPQDPKSNDLYGPDGILTNIANILSYATGIIAVFVMIVGGVKFVTNGGDSSRVSSARNTLIFGAVGLLVAFAAQAIIITVLNRL